MKKIIFILGIMVMLVISGFTIAETLNNEWKTGIKYNIGDKVTYNNLNYECMQGHTSLAGWNPQAVPALWKQVVTQPLNSNEFITSKAYKIGDKVTYNNINYVVLQAHNSQSDWTPDKVPALFKRDIDNNTKDTLKTELLNKYPDKFNNLDIEDVTVSIEYTVYSITTIDKVTGKENKKTWIVKE
jgi:hypothetical protein